jgi:hypothetical protein
MGANGVPEDILDIDVAGNELRGVDGRGGDTVKLDTDVVASGRLFIGRGSNSVLVGSPGGELNEGVLGVIKKSVVITELAGGMGKGLEGPTGGGGMLDRLVKVSVDTGSPFEPVMTLVKMKGGDS